MAGPTIISKLTYQEMYERGRKFPHFFAKDFLGVECHVGQIQWLMRALWDDSSQQFVRPKPKAKEGALAASNRWGKTFIEAVQHLHRAFYQIRDSKYSRDPASGLIRDYKTVNVAMSLDQALLAFNYAHAMATNSKMFKRFVIDHKGTPFPKLEIGVNTGREENRWKSEIWARSTAMRAKFLLGHNFNYLGWDEAAFDQAILQEGTDSVLDSVIRMRLADQGGHLDLISSPNGYNAFQRIWADGQNPRNADVYSMSGAIWQNVHPVTGQPFIDFDAVKKNMRRMHPDWILQNIQGMFAKMNNVFPVDAVMACYANQDYRFRGKYEEMGGMYLAPDYALDETWEVVLGAAVRGPGQPHRSEQHLRYVVGADLGRKKDFTCIVVLHLPEDETQPLRVVYFEMLQKAPWRTIFERIQRVSQIYNDGYTIIDSTAMGGDMALETLRDQYEFGEEGLDGRQFTQSVKENLITQLQAAIQSQSVVFPYIHTLVQQLQYYQREDKKLQTDAVFGLALAVEAAKVAMGMDAFERISSPDLPMYVLRRNGLNGMSIPLEFEDDLGVGPLTRVVLV